MEVQYDTHSLNINIITIVFKNLSEILKQTMGPNFWEIKFGFWGYNMPAYALECMDIFLIAYWQPVNEAP